MLKRLRSKRRLKLLKLPGKPLARDSQLKLVRRLRMMKIMIKKENQTKVVKPMLIRRKRKRRKETSNMSSRQLPLVEEVV